MASTLLRCICFLVLVLAGLSGCAPPDPEPIGEIKQPSNNPFAIGGYLPIAIKLDSINPRGWAFAFSYDALQRITKITIRSASNTSAGGEIKIGYLSGSFLPTEIRLTNLPPAIWPTRVDAVFNYEYNLVGKISKVNRARIVNANLAVIDQQCTYQYLGGLLGSSRVLTQPDKIDSTVVRSWSAGLAAEMTSYAMALGQSAVIQSFNAKHNADSSRFFYETSLSSNGRTTTTSQLSLRSLQESGAIYRYNPLWILTYLQYLQDLRMPPPRFDARLARITSGAGLGNCNNQVVPTYSFRVLPMGIDSTGDNRLLPPSRLLYEYNDLCGGGVVLNSGQVVSYVKAR